MLGTTLTISMWDIRRKMKKKVFIITGVATLVALISWSLYWNLYRGRLVINSDYLGASYEIDGKETDITSRINLRPGPHTLLVTLEDYNDGEYQFDISFNKTTEINVSGLLPNYLAQDEYIKPELKDRLNLIRKTPIKAPFGTVGFDYNQDKFVVDLSGGHSKEEALKWFVSQGTTESTSSIIWGS